MLQSDLIYCHSSVCNCLYEAQFLFMIGCKCCKTSFTRQSITYIRVTVVRKNRSIQIALKALTFFFFFLFFPFPCLVS